MKILIVDDDQGIVDLTAMSLESAGYQVFRAYDGIEAIQVTFREKPNLILLDVIMPRMDGFQVCRFLKNYPPFDRIPIIFLTARSGVGDRQRGLLRGGDDYISKPLDLDKLQKKIKVVMHSSAIEDIKKTDKIDVEKLKDLSDVSAVLKLGELLDDNLFKSNIMEEVSRAVADSLDHEEIIKLLLIGCMSDIGLGFDRAIYMVKSEDGKHLIGKMALGPFPESGVSQSRWQDMIDELRDKTLREIYAYDMERFPFLHEREQPFIADLVLEIPDGTRTYDLTLVPGDSDILRLAQMISQGASEKLRSTEVKAVPVVAKGQMIGVLVVDNSFCHRLMTNVDIKNLIILCNQVGLALERCRLLEEQYRWTKELERISNLNISILQSVNIGVSYLDPAGKVIIWNRAMARITGHDAYHVLGRGFMEVFPYLTDSIVAKRLEKVISSKISDRVGHFKMTFGRRGGFFDIKMSPVVTRGKMQGVVLCMEDYTTRVKLENKNREVFQYLSGIINYSADAIITTSDKGRIKTWNRGASDIFGYDETAVKGRNIGILFPRGKGSEKKDILGKVSQGKTIQDHETMLVSTTGERFYLSLTASPIKNMDGSVSAVSFFIRNITERKKLITQLIQTEKLASLGVMSAGMAHEINNPLTSIVLHAQLLEMTTKLPTEAKEYLVKIAEEVDRIAEIVNDLLIYSRSGDKQLEELRINEILDQAVVFIKRKTATDNIKVELSYDQDLPPLRGQSNEMLEIFLNILLNAVDAIESEGEIRIAATSDQRRNDDGTESRWLKIHIQDTGSGMPASEIPKIFDPFYTTKPPGKGTGLGLMVVNQLVNKYDGRIDVESRVGQGTTFTIDLPCR